ncbi:hypothetical protein [Persicitalea jodogahamensis]|uniref:hypothetical protein n=1 Tax=Persicitalea jodogahamensis TaxID=402147 RepID=UPI001676ED6A|nr:hypothetical protein [Persicitalea jodogahamensis]
MPATLSDVHAAQTLEKATRQQGVGMLPHNLYLPIYHLAFDKLPGPINFNEKN